MRVLQVIDKTTGQELGTIKILDHSNIYEENAQPFCKCGRSGPECQSPGEALDELLDHELQHRPERGNGHHELPWPIEF